MLKDTVEDRIKERFTLLRSGKAKAKLLSDLSYPNRCKSLDDEAIKRSLDEFEKIIPQLISLIKKVRPHFKFIGDQNNVVAVYLLLGKALKSLQGVLAVAMIGNISSMIELCRSGQEAIDLTMLFLDSHGQKFLEEWFKGKIIGNEEARKVMDLLVNEMMADMSKEPVPAEAVKKDIYWTYSQFTHSGYGSMSEMIDVYHEDFDFEGYAGSHYTRRSLHVIESLIVNILLGLKNTFLICKDLTALNETEKLLRQFSSQFASLDEIAKTYEPYKKEAPSK